MKKQLFLSYVHEDEDWVLRVERWATEGVLGDVEPIRMRKDWRQHGGDVVKSKLRGNLKSAHAAIIVVGADTHDRQWIEYEVDVILSADKPAIVVRIPNTTGAPPQQLRRHEEVPFKAEAIKAALKTIF